MHSLQHNHFWTSTQSTFDYYPFGMGMPGRGYTGDGYKYGFNGKEKDDELLGDGNAYDFGARIYDPRVGRWMSVDPFVKKYPGIGSYSSFNNNPLLYTDPTGKGGELTVDLENHTATLTMSLHLYAGEGVTKEDIYADLAKAFPEYKAGEPFEYQVPIGDGAEITVNNGNYLLTKVTVIIDVIDNTDVQKELDDHDQSHNYFMMQNDGKSEGGHNNSPTNVGYIRRATFNNDIYARNVMFEELWHSCGAWYDEDDETIGITDDNKFGSHGVNDEESIAGGGKTKNSANRKVTKNDAKALSVGNKKINKGLYNFKRTNKVGAKIFKAVAGKKANSPYKK